MGRRDGEGKEPSPTAGDRGVRRGVSGNSSFPGRQRQTLAHPDDVDAIAGRLCLRPLQFAGERDRAEQGKLLPVAQADVGNHPHRSAGLESLAGVLPSGFAEPEAAPRKEDGARAWPGDDGRGRQGQRRQPQHDQGASEGAGLAAPSGLAWGRPGGVVWPCLIRPHPVAKSPFYPPTSIFTCPLTRNVRPAAVLPDTLLNRIRSPVRRRGPLHTQGLNWGTGGRRIRATPRGSEGACFLPGDFLRRLAPAESGQEGGNCPCLRRKPATLGWI